MDKEISRREFLGRVGRIAVFGGLALLTESARGGFIYERRVLRGRAELFLPKGEEAPETGRYTHWFDRGTSPLNNIYVDSVVRKPTFRSEFIVFQPKGSLRIQVTFQIGRFDDAKPRSIARAAIEEVDFSKEHTFEAFWESWKISRLLWDKRQIQIIVPGTSSS